MWLKFWTASFWCFTTPLSPKTHFIWIKKKNKRSILLKINNGMIIMRSSERYPFVVRRSPYSWSWCLIDGWFLFLEPGSTDNLSHTKIDHLAESYWSLFLWSLRQVLQPLLPPDFFHSECLPMDPNYWYLCNDLKGFWLFLYPLLARWKTQVRATHRQLLDS